MSKPRSSNAALHLHGSRWARPPGEVEPEPAPLSALPLKPPAGLDGEHREVWQEVVDGAQPGQLAGMLPTELETLVDAIVLQRQARREVTEHGLFVLDAKGRRQRNPAAVLLAQQGRTITKLTAALRLSTAALPASPSGQAKLEAFRREGQRIDAAFREGRYVRDPKYPARVWPEGTRPVAGTDHAVPDDDDG